MKRIAIAIAAAGLIVGLSACEVPAEDGGTAQQSSDGTSAAKRDKAGRAAEAKAKPAKPAEPSLTVAQENAVRSAESYLDFSAFSRSGLIEQLEFEEYSTKDATFAVAQLDVNWNEQAAKSAESYLEYTAFSRGGLIDQLEFEGFTTAQATHGADKVGL